MERNSNKGLKKLVLLLLLFVGLGASVTAGAYWASSFTAKNPTDASGDLTVNIGKGGVVELETTLALGPQSDDSALELVPKGHVVSGSSTDTRVLTITAEWVLAPEVDSEYKDPEDPNKLVASGTLSAVVSNLSIDEVSKEDLENMFTITVSAADDIEFGSTADIVVKVVFTKEPETYALYNKIINKELTITITLSVVAKQ